MVLKQCGQLAITFVTPYFENVAMFCCACTCQRYSFPIRRAGSPLQVSSVPRIANETPAARRTCTSARATFWLRRSTDAAQPTKYSHSASGFSVYVGTPSSFAQSPLVSRGSPTYTDRKSTRLNSSHTVISYAVFCLKKKKK